MRLTYLYHSGYMVETDHCFVFFDYFLDGDARDEVLRTKSAVVPSLSLETQEPYILKKHYVGHMGEPLCGVPGVVMEVINHILTLKKPLYFIASHFHADHFQPFILKIYDYVKEKRASLEQSLTKDSEQSSSDVLKAQEQSFLPEVYLVLSYDIFRGRKKILRDYVGEFTFLEEGERVDLPHLSVEAFGSTDVGLSFGVYVDGYSIYHAGDMNYWHWAAESTEVEIAKSRELYDSTMSHLKGLLSHDEKTLVETFTEIKAGAALLKELDDAKTLQATQTADSKQCEDSSFDEHFPKLLELSQFKDGFDVVLYPCDPRLKTDVLTGALDFMEAFKGALLIPMHMWERPWEVIRHMKDEHKLQSSKLYVGSKALNQAFSVSEDKNIKLTEPSSQGFKIWVPLLSGDWVEVKK